MIESVETHASVSTRRAGGLDLPAFDFAVWFLQTSVRLGDLTPSYAAYWLESFPLTLERYRELSVK